MAERVSVGARLHAGFCNLSLARDRLYGGIGLSLSEPRTVVTAEKAPTVDCESDCARQYVQQVVSLLDVPGAIVEIEAALPRHVGLGSGTRLALGILTAIARAYDKEPAVRKRAPDLGRGGRSGVGVATFETDGFVIDAGQPTGEFTTAEPSEGDWTVPPVSVRHQIPEEWRVVLVVPDGSRGRSGTEEDAAMRTVIDQADPGISDQIARHLIDNVFPGIATRNVAAFGEGLGAIDRANGAWYTEVQGGVYRPPADKIVESLRSEPAAMGVGQSSWGPAVWAITDEQRVDEVKRAAQAALENADINGIVRVTTVTGGSARNA